MKSVIAAYKKINEWHFSRFCFQKYYKKPSAQSIYSIIYIFIYSLFHVYEKIPIEISPKKAKENRKMNCQFYSIPIYFMLSIYFYSIPIYSMLSIYFII